MRLLKLVLPLSLLVLTMPVKSVEAATTSQQVVVVLDEVMEYGSSNECQSETYIDFRVTVLGPNGEQKDSTQKTGIWKELTNRDKSTIPDCDVPVRVNEALTTHIQPGDTIRVEATFWEKDGGYHPAARFTKDVFDPADWAKQLECNTYFGSTYCWESARRVQRGDSVRDRGDYGDQDYEVTYSIIVTELREP
jgi:hypothetical protein